MSRQSTRCTKLLLAISILLGGCASGPKQHTNKNPCSPVSESDEVDVDKAQEQLESLSCEAALWVDGLGGQQGDVQAAKATHGYVETSVAYSEFDGFSTDSKVRIDTDLPVLQNRLRAFIGQERDDNYTRNRSETFALQSQFERNVEGGSWLAGLGYSIPGLERFESDISAGISGIPDSKLYVNFKNRFTIVSTQDKLLHLSVKPFWTNKSGFGVTADEDFSVVVTEGLLLRLLQVNTISERTRGLDWYAGVILYQKLTHERGLAWNVFANGQTDEPVPLRNFGAQVTFRAPLIPNKLNGELRVGVNFPKIEIEQERNSSGNISLNLIMPFGNSKENPR